MENETAQTPENLATTVPADPATYVATTYETVTPTPVEPVAVPPVTVAPATAASSIMEQRADGTIKTLLQQIASINWSYLTKPFSEFTDQEIQSAIPMAREVKKMVQIDGALDVSGLNIFKSKKLDEYFKEKNEKKEAERRNALVLGSPKFLKNHYMVKNIKMGDQEVPVWIFVMILLFVVILIVPSIPANLHPEYIYGPAIVVFMITVFIAIAGNKTNKFLTILDLRKSLFLQSNAETFGAMHIRNYPENVPFLQGLNDKIFPKGDRNVGCEHIVFFNKFTDFSGLQFPVFEQGDYWHEAYRTDDDSGGHYEKVTTPFILSSIENPFNKPIPLIHIRSKFDVPKVVKKAGILSNKIKNAKTSIDTKEYREVHFSAFFDSKFDSYAELAKAAGNSNATDELDVMSIISPEIQDFIVKYCDKWSFCITPSGYFIAIPPKVLNSEYLADKIDCDTPKEEDVTMRNDLARFAYLYHEIISNIDPTTRLTPTAKAAFSSAFSSMVSEI
ncbi:MAG: hypothetical protein LBN03_01230 [Bifidobacteriaceae bacterium]|jgi:hypothetical protein|nr:hypothetical protein [Bifidobacteriaceae bacterium]